MTLGRTIAVLYRKDLRVELRAKDTLVMLGFFALVLVMVFTFGFSLDPATNRRVFPSIVWALLLFAGTLAVGRTFARESRDGAFTALVLSPAPRGGLLLAKTLVNVTLTTLVVALAVPVVAVMMRVDLMPVLLPVAAQLFLGAWGFALVGTPLAVMAVNARFAEVLLPMLVFPLVSPVLIAGVTATGATLGTIAADDPATFVRLMAAFDVVYAVGGYVLFERLLTE